MAFSMCLSRQCRRSGAAARLPRHVARASKQSFDEGAAQVANLLKRDEDELTGKAGIGSNAFTEFGQTAGKDTLATVEDFPDAFKPAGGGDAAPRSPFGASSSAASPFGSSAAPSSSARSPFGDSGPAVEPSNLSPGLQPDPVSEAPWWTKITGTQIFLACSFTLMTLSMLATIIFVTKTGAIHFNSDAY